MFHIFFLSGKPVHVITGISILKKIHSNVWIMCSVLLCLYRLGCSALLQTRVFKCSHAKERKASCQILEKSGWDQSGTAKIFQCVTEGEKAVWLMKVSGVKRADYFQIHLKMLSDRNTVEGEIRIATGSCSDEINNFSTKHNVVWVIVYNT